MRIDVSPWKIYKKFLEIIERITEYLLLGLVGAMVVIVFLQVIFRFVLHSSLPWSEEASRYIMVWLSLLAAGIALRHKGHIGVEAVFNLFGIAQRRFLSLLIGGVEIYFFSAMIFYGVKVLKVVVRQNSPAMEISMGIPYSSIVVGGFLMWLYAAEYVGDTLKEIFRGAES